MRGFFAPLRMTDFFHMTKGGYDQFLLFVSHLPALSVTGSLVELGFDCDGSGAQGS